MTNDKLHNPDHDAFRDDPEIQALLKDYPVPQADKGFFDRALLRATHKGAQQQRNRWLMTGFGGAIAAGLAVWMIGSMLMTTPEVPDAATSIAGVSMTLEEPRTVNLVFSATEVLESATLTVSLPSGVELAGFPGQSEISWETSLQKGRNLLPLKLIALTPAGGELLARLEHEDRGRVFRLQLDIS